jgi:hypothetical protein
MPVDELLEGVRYQSTFSILDPQRPYTPLHGKALVSLMTQGFLPLMR